MADSRRRNSGRRTDYVWSSMGDLQTAVDLSTSVGQFGTTVLILNEPGTIVRIRGKVGAYMDSVAAEEHVLLLLGLTIVTEDQATAGAAPEIFNAGTDDASWIWQGQIWLHAGVSVVAGSEEGQHGSVECDTKAMRRVKATERLAFVFYTPAELTLDSAGTYDLAYFFHVLLGT